MFSYLPKNSIMIMVFYRNRFLQVLQRTEGFSPESFVRLTAEFQRTHQTRRLARTATERPHTKAMGTASSNVRQRYVQTRVRSKPQTLTVHTAAVLWGAVGSDRTSLTSTWNNQTEHSRSLRQQQAGLHLFGYQTTNIWTKD